MDKRVPNYLPASANIETLIIPRFLQTASPRHGLPGSRLQGGKLRKYVNGESHPCILDTGNPCRYDGLKGLLLPLKVIHNQERV
ncbi:MAG: hypothetical protein PHY16_08745 [Methylobacter sp.]|nr:hypothetical protein [Methylobacter sp.]